MVVAARLATPAAAAEETDASVAPVARATAEQIDAFVSGDDDLFERAATLLRGEGLKVASAEQRLEDLIDDADEALVSNKAKRVRFDS